MNSSKRGFTLLEVLVALAIFATAAIATIRSVSQHLNTLSALEEKMFAAMVADNQMAKVMLSTGNLRKEEGKATLAEREWYWMVEPLSTNDDLLQGVDVKVATSANAAPVVTVRSYVPK